MITYFMICEQPLSIFLRKVMQHGPDQYVQINPKIYPICVLQVINETHFTFQKS